MNLAAILDREVRERRRTALIGALLVLVAIIILGSIVWSYVQ